MNYGYQKICECGKVDFIKVDKFEAAFGLKEEEISDLNCTKCGKKTAESILRFQPEIDRVLLVDWANNPEFHFCQQDEDVALGQYKENVNLYNEFIDNPSISENKRNILKTALSVINNGENKISEDNSKHKYLLESNIQESINKSKVKSRIWVKLKKHLTAK